MKLLLLWHLHQPMYKTYTSGRYWLPWTYLHLTKDYYEMARIVEQSERVKVTFNLVPSLIESIEDYAAGRAEDAYLESFLTSPETMSLEDRTFVIENFFDLNLRLIHAHPRYHELYLRRAEKHEFSAADLRDLQVLFHLAWLGESWKRDDADVKRLVAKQRNYSEEDRRLLSDKMTAIFRAVLPLYKSLWDKGRIEISATPYYHPILPLICRSDAARESTPGIELGGLGFRFPDDAREHVRLALDKVEAAFGRRPTGMWPAEGSVSDAALEILSEFSLSWAATDEAILQRSLPPDARRDGAHFTPYLFERGRKRIALFFRDHGLSDLIGFVYQRWREAEAVEDFIGRLRRIENHHPGAVVSVILDGENAWEHYRANGYEFLTLLYRRLEQESWIETLTFSECAKALTSLGTLHRVHPGSWIDANFNTWIGDEEKNTAWKYLERARKLVDERSTTPTNQELVEKSILAAEGSDWFWWFGEPHHSAHDPIFDLIFRTHLKNVYAGLGLEAPSYLDAPIGIHMGALVQLPTAFMRPAIDGRETHYFEWMPAGLVNLQSQGAMHRTGGVLSKFFFGFDEENLYLRVDFKEKASKVLAASRLRIELYSAQGEMVLEFAGEKIPPRAAAATCVEAKVPLAELSVSFGEPFDAIIVVKDGHEIERYPQVGAMRLVVPKRDFEAENWCV
jgi:alpha-amylase/alpha-mannosidase (GH57 family)